MMIVATVPIVVCGLAFKEQIDGPLRSLYIVAGAMIGLAVLLAVAEGWSRTRRRRGWEARDWEQSRWGDAITTGLAQAAALVPGVSRSGVTITAGLFCGLSREAAARFSFLLSLPSVLAAGVYQLYKAREQLLGTREDATALAIATAASAIVGYLSIAFLLKFLKTHTTYVFIAYRLVLGSLILFWLYNGKLTATDETGSPPETKTAGTDSDSAESARDSSVANVIAAFDRIPIEARAFEFDAGEAIDFARGGHLQGIQFTLDTQGRHLAHLSHDSETVAYLVVVDFGKDLKSPGRVIHVQSLPSDGRSPPLRHAGGFQLAAHVLAVGVEDNQQKTRSEVQFWDVARAEKPVQLAHLTVRRAGEAKDKTAGAVGLVKREQDYLLAVANWDSRAIDLYLSNGKPLEDPQCQFEFKARWRNADADKADWLAGKVFGAYQAINLVTGGSGNVFLVGFNTTITNQDVADLYSLDVEGTPTRLLRKLAAKTMKLPAGNHFQAAGGLWVYDGRLAILSGDQRLSRTTHIGIADGGP